MTLIDSSAWIHSLRPDGDDRVTARVRRLLETGEAAWCPMVRLELWNGAQGTHEKRVLKDMERDLTELPLDQAVWRAAYDLAHRARQQGITAMSEGTSSECPFFQLAQHTSCEPFW